MAELEGASNLINDLKAIKAAAADALPVLRETQMATGGTGVASGFGMGSGLGGRMAGATKPRTTKSDGGSISIRQGWRWGHRIVRGIEAIGVLGGIHDSMREFFGKQEGREPLSDFTGLQRTMKAAEYGIQDKQRTTNAILGMAALIPIPAVRAGVAIAGTIAGAAYGKGQTILDEAKANMSLQDAIRKYSINAGADTRTRYGPLNFNGRKLDFIGAYQQGSLEPIYGKRSLKNANLTEGKAEILEERYGSSQAALEAIQKSVALREEAYKNILEGNYAANAKSGNWQNASAELRAANAIDSNTGKMWYDPGAIYTAHESARLSARRWAHNQMPRGASRTGDD